MRRPRIAAVLRPAPWKPPTDPGLYWVVLTARSRYWIGPAQGPAAHIHQEQAARLAAHLQQSAQSGASRRRRVR